jgi:Mn-dependent DtxR family transcriptional regulator
MVSMAWEALSNISERRVAHYTDLADVLRIGHYYAQLICRLLGRDNYIAIDANGMCKITPKGENYLKANDVVIVT